MNVTGCGFVGAAREVAEGRGLDRGAWRASTVTIGRTMICWTWTQGRSGTGWWSTALVCLFMSFGATSAAPIITTIADTIRTRRSIQSFQPTLCHLRHTRSDDA